MFADDIFAMPVDLSTPGEWITNLGPSGLLVIAVLLVFTGRLVPRSLYKERVQECNRWREIALKSMGHTDQLMPAAHIASQVSRALAGQVTSALTDVPDAPPVRGEREADR